MYDCTLFFNPFVEIMIKLYQARDAFFKALNIELEEIGLNYSQAFVLAALKMSNRPLTVSEIALFLSREVQSASELVARMEKFDYIKKTPSENDKRRITIRLTPKGIECAGTVSKSILGLCKRLLSSFSDEQLKQFDTYLLKVRNQAVEEVGTEIQELPSHIPVDGMNKWISQIQDEQSSRPSRMQA